MVKKSFILMTLLFPQFLRIIMTVSLCAPTFTYPGVSALDLINGDFNLRPLPALTVLIAAITNGDDTVFGTGGNDDINVLGGNDLVFAGAGDDWVRGSNGNDTVYGEDGNDQLNGGSGADQLFGGKGSDGLIGGLDDDRLYGGQGQDLLKGDAGNDLLSGDTGNDFVYGGIGADDLYGGIGNDLLNGGDGDDRLSGGMGDNAMYGGAGNDTFVFNESELGGSQYIDGGDGVDLLRIQLNNPGAYTIAQATAFLDAAFASGPDDNGVYHLEGFGCITNIEKIVSIGLADGNLNYMIHPILA